MRDLPVPLSLTLDPTPGFGIAPHPAAPALPLRRCPRRGSVTGSGKAALVVPARAGRACGCQVTASACRVLCFAGSEAPVMVAVKAQLVVQTVVAIRNLVPY
ncbi:unnamed protein product [Coccothraustes coccothraustes]